MRSTMIKIPSSIKRRMMVLLVDFVVSAAAIIATSKLRDGKRFRARNKVSTKKTGKK